MVLVSRYGLPWNDPALTDVHISCDAAALHVLYAHTAVVSDLLGDWSRAVPPKQAAPWLDEAVAKSLLGGQFFVQSQTTYSISLKVPLLLLGSARCGELLLGAVLTVQAIDDSLPRSSRTNSLQPLFYCFTAHAKSA